MTEIIYDVVIIGSGPAGLTAAIYNSRANLSTLVIGGSNFGGQLMLTTEVEDFPGFPDGINGQDLIFKMRTQAEKFGTKTVQEDVTKVDLSKRPFKITTTESAYASRSVIVATGASAKWLGLKDEQRLIGRGVSACAVCDGAFFRDKKVVVVGGGDAAMREALFLTKYADVTVIHRRDTLAAFEILQARAKANPKIKFIWNTVVEGIIGEDKVTGLKIKNVKTNAVSEIETDGFFVAIGHKPNTEIFADYIEIGKGGYAVATDETKTKIEGVFVAGDVHDHQYQQAITAAGSGCKAALDVEDFLAEKS